MWQTTLCISKLVKFLFSLTQCTPVWILMKLLHYDFDECDFVVSFHIMYSNMCLLSCITLSYVHTANCIHWFQAYYKPTVWYECSFRIHSATSFLQLWPLPSKSNMAELVIMGTVQRHLWSGNDTEDTYMQHWGEKCFNVWGQCNGCENVQCQRMPHRRWRWVC